MKMGSSSDSCEYIQLIKKSSFHWEILLNRPEKYNAITTDMYRSLTTILTEASKDEQLVLISLTGKGKFYSSGTDLSDPAKAFMSSDDIETSLDQARLLIKTFIDTFINCPKILIAFLNGPAIGIAVTLLGLFDGVYASSSSTFALPFIRTAQSPEGCSSYTFPQLMGSIHAKDILLFDRKLNAIEAYQRGLVTRIIDEKHFQEEKDKICQEILSLPKQSLLASKALIQKWNIQTLKHVNEIEVNLLKQRWTSEEFAQAILSFLNQRKKSNL